MAISFEATYSAWSTLPLYSIPSKSFSNQRSIEYRARIWRGFIGRSCPRPGRLLRRSRLGKYADYHSSFYRAVSRNALTRFLHGVSYSNESDIGSRRALLIYLGSQQTLAYELSGPYRSYYVSSYSFCQPQFNDTTWGCHDEPFRTQWQSEKWCLDDKNSSDSSSMNR